MTRGRSSAACENRQPLPNPRALGVPLGTPWDTGGEKAEKPPEPCPPRPGHSAGTAADEQRLQPVSHGAESDAAHPPRVKYRLFYVFWGTTPGYVPGEKTSFPVALTVDITWNNEAAAAIACSGCSSTASTLPGCWEIKQLPALHCFLIGCFQFSFTSQ